MAAMLTTFDSLDVADPLSRAVDLTLQGSQQDVPVFERDEVVGILSRADLLRGLAERSPGAAVAEAMRRDFPRVEAGEMLKTLFARLQECRCHTAPVTHSGRVVGADHLREHRRVPHDPGRPRGGRAGAAGGLPSALVKWRFRGGPGRTCRGRSGR